MSNPKQLQAFPMPYAAIKLTSVIVSSVVRTGAATVRERMTFGGTAWRPKRLELDDTHLHIINTSNSKRVRIALSDVSELERTDLADHSIVVNGGGRRYNIAFSTDSELYDWQDDIYRRTPLGGYSSSPFDFVHKSHIGTGIDTVSGTFTDPNIVPIYAEIIGAQPPVITRSSSGIAIAPRSRPASGVPFTTIAKGIATSPPPPNGNLAEGCCLVKTAGIFSSWRWKQRWLTLTPQMLVIHCSPTKTSSHGRSIALSTIRSIEIDEKRDHCLVIEYGYSPSSFGTPLLMIAFSKGDEMYTWRDAIYARSALSSRIGEPTDFSRHIHVGFDQVSGAFTGLPKEWASLVNPASSAPTDRQARRQSRRKSAPLVEPISS